MTAMSRADESYVRSEGKDGPLRWVGTWHLVVRIEMFRTLINVLKEHVFLSTWGTFSVRLYQEKTKIYQYINYCLLQMFMKYIKMHTLKVIT